MTVAAPEVAAAAVEGASAGSQATAAAAVKETAAKKMPAKKAAADPQPGQGAGPRGATGKPAAGQEKTAPPDALTRARSTRKKAAAGRREAASLLPRPSLRGSGSRRALVGEFIGCAVIISLAPITDKHAKDTPATALRRMSALALMFLVLGLVATTGPKSSRVAAGMGGLITLALLVSERDVLVVLAQRFSGPADSGVGKGAAEVGVGAGAYIGPLDTSGAAGPPAGTVGRSRPV